MFPWDISLPPCSRERDCNTWSCDSRQWSLQAALLMDIIWRLHPHVRLKSLSSLGWPHYIWSTHLFACENQVFSKPVRLGSSGLHPADCCSAVPGRPVTVMSIGAPTFHYQLIMDDYWDYGRLLSPIQFIVIPFPDEAPYYVSKVQPCKGWRLRSEGLKQVETTDQ